jgi:hypothetical protein
MLRCCRLSFFTPIGFLLLGVTGCGGGMPTTGETLDLKERPEVAEARKQNIQEFFDKGPQPKGRAGVKK